jgi:valyl-tRNA synthetase
MVRLVTVVKKDKFSLISWFEQFKKKKTDKLGGYTVKEWRQMIEDKVVADISDEVLEFVKPNIFERKMLKKKARKESVTEELYYVRNEGFLGNALLWWTKGCNGYT